MKFYDFQQRILEASEGKTRVAYYLDMGLGKTFVGAEKLRRLNEPLNLVVCQKSKISDWVEHLKEYVSPDVYDLSKKANYESFIESKKGFGVINYDLVWRRKELLKLKDFSLMLDESSMVQNESSKRTKCIMKMKAKNIVLLSGTPVGGKYENLYSQCRLLGWEIPKKDYWDKYIITKPLMIQRGFRSISIKLVVGYKNIEHLKRRLRENGAFFMKASEVYELPKQVFINKPIPTTKDYKTFLKNDLCKFEGVDYIGDTSLTKLLYTRFFASPFNSNKADVFKDLIESTDERIIVFYNFKSELEVIEKACKSANKPFSQVNGSTKDLTAYENEENSITAIQFQSGSMGLNLQKASQCIYYSPCLSSELFQQSLSRVCRIGQERTCFYYFLKSGIEEDIYKTLAERRDYTNELFQRIYQSKG